MGENVICLYIYLYLENPFRVFILLIIGLGFLRENYDKIKLLLYNLFYLLINGKGIFLFMKLKNITDLFSNFYDYIGFFYHNSEISFPNIIN